MCLSLGYPPPTAVIISILSLFVSLKLSKSELETLNSLKKLLHVLKTGENEIFVEDQIISSAKNSIEKLLKFTSNNQSIGLANDA